MSYRAFTRLRALFIVVVVVAAGVVGWFLVCGRRPIRNVILISIDTCRADHLNCYGFTRKTTPNIDAIAGEGILFKNAITPIPLTLPAHSSMLTGTYPLYHKVRDNLNHKLDESNVTVAEILRKQGYTTGAVVSCFVLDRQFGTGQGFDSYNDKFENPIGPQDFERRGDEASRFACNWLEEHRDEPFFLFLHYFDPHTDYDPPEPFATIYADDLYTGEIAYTDHCLAQVIDKLKGLGLYDSILIIIVGDHGEGLGEHGEAEHGYYIYEPMIKVPFIVRPPGCRKPGRVDGIVSLVDVVPTILSYLGIPIPAHVQGKDLSGYCGGRTFSPQRYLYCESLTATKYGCNPLLGLIDEQWKYIETTRPELYELAGDPLEENNLIEKEAKRAWFMQAHLQELTAKLASDIAIDSELRLDDKSRRRLESLGYVGTAVVDASGKFDQTKPDPKDLISYHEDNQRVVYLISHERLDEAKAICERMLADWPDMPDTYLQLGRVTFEKGEFAESITHNAKYLALVSQVDVQHPESPVFNPNKPTFMTHNLLGAAYYQLEQYDKAVEHYTAVLAIKSGQPDMHNNLASAFFKLGKTERAAEHWTEALRLKPGWPEVHNNLAGAYYRLDKIDEAIEHWAEALRLKPDWTEVRDNLNKLTARKERDAEIAQYTEMLQRNPDDPNTHSKLAAAFYRKGDVEKAIEHWTKVVEFKPDAAEVKNNLAWVLATVEDEKLRNPGEAVRLAEGACELTDYNQPEMLDTLGVAYAAAGRFDEAVEIAEKARELAVASGRKELVSDIEKHLELYKVNKPYSD